MKGKDEEKKCGPVKTRSVQNTRHNSLGAGAWPSQILSVAEDLWIQRGTDLYKTKIDFSKRKILFLRIFIFSTAIFYKIMILVSHSW